MIDIVDKQTRSRMMSGIRSKNTKPEILTRSALHSLGYRFRLDSKVGKISPDVILRKRKVAIFIHGCYWHQHEGCMLAYSDRNYSEKWIKKFDDNRQRDQRVLKQLLDNGWKVAVVWECSTRDTDIFGDTINQLDGWIRRKGDDYFESQYKK